VVDIVELDAAGDQLIELETAIEIGLREKGKVASRPRAALA
jgi:hypothetical protein